MRVSLYTVLILSLLAATTAFAEGVDNKGGHHKFNKIDLNKDSSLTRDELEAHYRKKIDRIFEKTDADKDGKLSDAELQKGREKWDAKMRRRFEKMKERQGLVEGKKPEQAQ